MLVSECMTPNPIVVQQTDPIAEVIELLRHHHIHQVLVLNLDNRLVGIVTDRDLRSAIGYEENDKLNLIVQDIMTKDVMTVYPAMDVREALDLLCRYFFGSLPVVVGDEVVGILSARDMLRTLKRILDQQESDQSGLEPSSTTMNS